VSFHILVDPPVSSYSAHQRDGEFADRLEHYEHIGLSNQWNGPKEREKRSSSHHESNKVKIQLQDKNIGKYETLGEEVELLREKKGKYWSGKRKLILMHDLTKSNPS